MELGFGLAEAERLLVLTFGTLISLYILLAATIRG